MLNLLPSDAWQLIVEHFCDGFLYCNSNELEVCGETAATHLLNKAWCARYSTFMRHFCAFRTMSKVWSKVFSDKMLAKLNTVRKFVSCMQLVREVYAYHRQNAGMSSYTLCVQAFPSNRRKVMTTLQRIVPRSSNERNQCYLRRMYGSIIVRTKKLACYWPTLVYLIDQEAVWHEGPVWRSGEMFEWPRFQDNNLYRALSIQEHNIVVSMRLCEMIKGVRNVYCPWVPTLLTSQQT